MGNLRPRKSTDVASPSELLSEILRVVPEVIGERLNHPYAGPLIELAIIGADPDVPAIVRSGANGKLAEFLYARQVQKDGKGGGRPIQINLVSFTPTGAQHPQIGVVIEGERDGDQPERNQD